jgi:hypothetical protein
MSVPADPRAWSAASVRPGARPGALLALIALALGLRLLPIGHGFPATAYVPDTHVVRGALGMAAARDLVPPAGTTTSYPYLLPYLLLPIYGVEYAAGRARGAWAGPGEYGERLLEEPARAHLPARILVACFGALTVLVVFRWARGLGLSGGAWAAAWLVACGTLHVHFSVQERPWVPLAFFLTWSAAAASAYLLGTGTRALLASGAAAGLAFATHQGGLLALGIPALAWVLGLGGPAAGGASAGRQVARGAGALCAFALLALVLGHPYYLVHGSAASEHVSGGLGGDIAVGGQAFSYRFRLASLGRMLQAFAGYDAALLVLAVGGLWPLLRTRAALPGLAFALGWGAIFLTNFNDHVRYLLPLAVLLAPAAGRAAEGLARAPLGRVALAMLLALPLVQSLRLVQLLRRADTRELAAEKLAAAAGTSALDIYGPDVALDRASLERLADLRPLYTREASRLERLRAGVATPQGVGLDAVRLEDLFEYDARSHASRVRAGAAHLGGDAMEVLEALGVESVLLVDRDPGDGAPPFPLDRTPAPPGAQKLAPLELDGPALWCVSPARGGATPWEARLPTELSFALVSLWQVERPGPELAFHRLAKAPK